MHYGGMQVLLRASYSRIGKPRSIRQGTLGLQVATTIYKTTWTDRIPTCDTRIKKPLVPRAMNSLTSPECVDKPLVPRAMNTLTSPEGLDQPLVPRANGWREQCLSAGNDVQERLVDVLLEEGRVFFDMIHHHHVEGVDHAQIGDERDDFRCSKPAHNAPCAPPAVQCEFDGHFRAHKAV